MAPARHPRLQPVNLAGTAIEATRAVCALSSPRGSAWGLWYRLGMDDRILRGGSAGTGVFDARRPGKSLILKQVTLAPRALSGIPHGPIFRLQPLQ